MHAHREEEVQLLEDGGGDGTQGDPEDPDPRFNESPFPMSLQVAATVNLDDSLPCSSKKTYLSSLFTPKGLANLAADWRSTQLNTDAGYSRDESPPLL